MMVIMMIIVAFIVIMIIACKAGTVVNVFYVAQSPNSISKDQWNNSIPIINPKGSMYMIYQMIIYKYMYIH